MIPAGLGTPIADARRHYYDERGVCICVVSGMQLLGWLEPEPVAVRVDFSDGTWAWRALGRMVSDS